MPVWPSTGVLNRLRLMPWLAAAVLSVCVAGLSKGAGTPARLTLEQLAERQPAEYTPRHAAQKVVVRGVVSARAFHFPEYALLPFEDAQFGAVVEVAGDGHQIDNYSPGDEIEVEGTVSSHAGMVTIQPDGIRTMGAQPAPKPQTLAPEALLGFRYLGKLIHTGGKITEIGETVAGPYILLATRRDDLRLFLPHGSGARSADIRKFSVGDTVEATGVALQYCPTPPYNRWFEILVRDPAQLVLTDRGPLVHPAVVAGGVAGAILLALVLWKHDRRLRGQRERLSRTYQLAEQILSASSVEAILEEISQALPKVLGISRVQLYIYNRGPKTLDSVVSPSGSAAPVSISLSPPPEGIEAGAVACFHYRTALAIPDVGRSPFPMTANSGRSVLFVPMLSQREMVGVLELDQTDRPRDFTPDEQALAQHLGNQIGVAIRLLDQRSVQEHLFRTEKLAAVGRLISGVVNQLRTPLASIAELADRAVLQSRVTAAERDLTAIASEAQKASAIVSRLVSFATAEQGEALPVCITTLLRNLMEFRERDWKASGIGVRDLTSPDPMFVLGSHGQLEQAFLTLLLHAEQSLADAADKSITIRSSAFGKRLLVEIAFPSPPEARPPGEATAVLDVTRSVLAGHGGEVRLLETNHSEPRFEVELPLSARERAAAVLSRDASPTSGTPLTVLLIEPEETAQRQLRDQLSARGHRVVPVTNADTGLELAQRMRFDAAFCSVHAPGLNWVELSERLQSRVGGFVLLSDRYDAELVADFEGEHRFVLAKPLEEAGLDRVLANIDSPASARDQVV
jgi:GAF domain-containing protein/CheY-like chemotaxis protein